MAKINTADAPERVGSGYPTPFDQISPHRIKQALGDAGGLRDFGVNLVRLPAGNWSSQRHWHSHEDEFIYILSGEVTLVTDAGEDILRAGDCAAFPKGQANGHHLINKSSQEAMYLEVGSRNLKDDCHYSDIDLHYAAVEGWYSHKDGTPYPRKT